MKYSTLTKDILVLLFAGSVYFSAAVINPDSLNMSKLYGFGSLVLLYFIFRVNGNTGEREKGRASPNPSEGGGLPPLRGGLGRGLIFKFSNVKRYVLPGMLVLWGLFEAILGLMQLYGYMPSRHGLFRLTGTFFNPGPYAGFLAVVAPLALYYLISIRKTMGYTENTGNVNWMKKFYVPGIQIVCAITLVAIVLVLPAAMSRAAWLAAIGGIIICVNGCTGERVKGYTGKEPPLTPPKEGDALPFGEGRGGASHVYTKILVVVLIIAAAAGMYFLKKDSADGRLLTWKISLQTVVKHPLGVGLGNFSGAYGDTQAEYFAAGKGSEQEKYVAGNLEYGFNEYLQILVESGIVSFLLFMAIVFLSVKSLLRFHSGMAGSLVALLIFAGFSYPFSLWEFLLIFTFLIEPPLTPPKGENSLPFGEGRGGAFIRFSKILLIAGLGIFLIIKQIPYYKADSEWKRNGMLYHAGLYKDVIEAYKPLYPYLNDRTAFLFEYGRSLSQMELYGESDRVLQRAV
ncbi:MAG: O-antigen ligase family protein, partial [Tannerella sp.]|nr:O-antigen ligase family protein [Tannerella sp.]